MADLETIYKKNTANFVLQFEVKMQSAASKIQKEPTWQSNGRRTFWLHDL